MEEKLYTFADIKDAVSYGVSYGYSAGQNAIPMTDQDRMAAYHSFMFEKFQIAFGKNPDADRE